MIERTLCYTSSVEVSITQFRRDIFSLVNQALDGGEVWFTHKGRRLKIVPEGQPVSRLSRITSMEIMVDPAFDMNYPVFKAEMLAEMQKEWESDWSTL
jgi:hypothetical protein